MNSDPKRLLYVCFQTTVDGTAAKSHVFGVVRGLEPLGWSVRLVRVRYAEGVERPAMSRRLQQIGTTILEACIGALGARVVYVRSHFVAFPVSLLAKLLGRPVVQELNGPYSDAFIAWPLLGRIRRLVTWLICKQLQWAHAVITVTPNLKRWVYEESRARRIYVIPNAADANLFKPIPGKAAGLPPKYVVFFGVLAAWQGVDALVEAARNPKWPRDLSLVIAGDGAQRELVVRAARECRSVVYLGKVRQGALPGIVSGSIAAAIPNNNRGDRSTKGLSPIKLYEALACGVPVIVSDFPGSADLVREHRCGLVIPHDDVDALLDAILYVHEHPREGREMGERGREAVVRHHSWEQRARDTSVVLVRTLAASGPRKG